MCFKIDLVDLLEVVVMGELDWIEWVEWDFCLVVCVVMVSEGYFGIYEKGKVICGLVVVLRLEDVKVFYVGMKFVDGYVVINGGWVLGVIVLG